jgi:exonuclease III
MTSNLFGLRLKFKVDQICFVVFSIGIRMVNVQNFMDHLNVCLQKIHREEKNCIIMGDFNLDLLKYDNHEDTNNFINTMSNFSFNP